MGGRRSAQPLKVVAPLERGHNLAATTGPRDLQNRTGGPCEILGLQGLVREWIPTMGVKPGRDQDQIGSESVERGHEPVTKGRAP